MIETWMIAVASVAGGIFAGVISAVVAATYQARRDRERRHHDLVTAVREGIDARIQTVVADQRESDRLIHEKVSSLRDDTVRQLLDRLATIEGRLVSIDTWIQLMQRKFMDVEGSSL